MTLSEMTIFDLVEVLESTTLVYIVWWNINDPQSEEVLFHGMAKDVPDVGTSHGRLMEMMVESIGIEDDLMYVYV